MAAETRLKNSISPPATLATRFVRQPRRLSWHPGADAASGWTSDGKSVLFNSPREVARDLDRLYTVPASGGVPRLVALPSDKSASFSHGGQRLAYVPHSQWQPAWKNYRGGQVTPIWLSDLATSHATAIPRATNGNDKQPMRVGEILSKKFATPSAPSKNSVLSQ